MNSANSIPGTKVHPATRPVEPDDPMNLHGYEVPGDTELMLRMLVEEYARMGWDLEALMPLFHDPFYQGFHGLLRLYGEEELRKRVGQILSRCGVIRTRDEIAPPPEQLVQLSSNWNSENRNQQSGDCGRSVDG